MLYHRVVPRSQITAVLRGLKTKLRIYLHLELGVIYGYGQEFMYILIIYFCMLYVHLGEI